MKTQDDTPDRALCLDLGEGRILTGEEAKPYLADWRGRHRGKAICVALPRTTAEVAQILRHCHEHGIPVVPQGGRTGLVGGGIPDDGGRAIVLSLDKMDRLRGLDAAGMTLTCDAGMILSVARAHAHGAGLQLPILIGSEGSARIGGVLATNAGGSNVLRHGMTRNLVLGIEAVLPDGTVLDTLRPVVKDNTGLALDQLFVGSEGVLGVITGAILQLSPAPRRVMTALCHVMHIAAALELLGALRRDLADSLVAFEYMDAAAVGLIAAHVPDQVAAIALPAADTQLMLIEVASGAGADDIEALFQSALFAQMESGLLTEVLIAANEAQRAAFWQFRESISFAQNHAGPSIKMDVSVPVSAIPDLLEQGGALVRAISPIARPICYGHLGDGNIHFNTSPVTAADGPALLAAEAGITEGLARLVEAMGGSFSAEHGIGQAKAGLLAQLRAGPEMELMRAIKAAIDPKGIMNPGKML
ncbi:FAD-binding oxidoreductase [Paracoccaceae bacterium]